MQVQETISYKQSLKLSPNMGTAAPRAPVGGGVQYLKVLEKKVSPP